MKNLGRKITDRDQGSKTYWTVFNRLLNRKKVMNIPPLLENCILVTNVQTKATMLNNFFVQQCSTIATGNTIPTFLPRYDKTLHDVMIDRVKVLRLIRSLDSNKAHGLDGISADMIKLYDSSLVEHCVLFLRNVLKQPSTLQYGKKVTLSLFIKRKVDRIRKIIVEYCCCRSLVKCLKRLILMLCTSTFVTTTF